MSTVIIGEKQQQVPMIFDVKCLTNALITIRHTHTHVDGMPIIIIIIIIYYYYIMRMLIVLKVHTLQHSYKVYKNISIWSSTNDSKEKHNGSKWSA